MSKGPQTFRQRDVSAAIKAARQAGCTVERIEITKDGKIVIVTGCGAEAVIDDDDENPWDKALGLPKESR
jgi:hypothetical protein